MTFIYHRRPEAMQTDLGDELIVVDGGTGRSFRLNASARNAWLRLPTTAEQLADHFVHDYALSPEEALRDARSALQAFVANGIAMQG